MTLFETPRFLIEIGTIDGDKDPQYLVRSKANGVVEFCNTSLYFVRDWALQMTEALDEQDEKIESMARGPNVITFPGGSENGRTN
jgi:hypothetical protein